MLKTIALCILLSLPLAAVDWAPATGGAYVPNGSFSWAAGNTGMAIVVHSVDSGSVRVTYTRTSGDDASGQSTADFSVSGSFFLRSSGSGYTSEYNAYSWNGSSWILDSAGISGLSPLAADVSDLVESYYEWLIDNSLTNSQQNIRDFLSGYDPEAEPCPETFEEFPWSVLPAQLAPNALNIAIADTNIDNGEWDEWEASGATYDGNDFLIDYQTEGDSGGIIIGIYDEFNQKTVFQWWFRSCEEGYYSLVGQQHYWWHADQWQPQGDFHYNQSPDSPPESTAPPADPPEDIPAPAYDEDETSAELDELKRLNYNVNAQTDVIKNASDKSTESDEQTRDMLRSMSADAAEFQARSEAQREEAMDLDKDRNAILNRMDQKLQTLIDQNEEGIKIDGEVGEYNEYEPGDSGFSTGAVSSKSSVLSAKIPAPEIDYDGEFTTAISFSLPNPTGGSTSYDFDLMPDTSTSYGSALDLGRQVIRLLLCLIIFYWWLRLSIHTVRV